MPISIFQHDCRIPCDYKIFYCFCHVKSSFPLGFNLVKFHEGKISKDVSENCLILILQSLLKCLLNKLY